jgi:hypothetical protein
VEWGRRCRSAVTGVIFAIGLGMHRDIVSLFWDISQQPPG